MSVGESRKQHVSDTNATRQRTFRRESKHMKRIICAAACIALWYGEALAQECTYYVWKLAES